MVVFLQLIVQKQTNESRLSTRNEKKTKSRSFVELDSFRSNNLLENKKNKEKTSEFFYFVAFDFLYSKD